MYVEVKWQCPVRKNLDGTRNPGPCPKAASRLSGTVHPVLRSPHQKFVLQALTMRRDRWNIVASTSPADEQTAREQERWLKLGDDALHNRPQETSEEATISPGTHAVKRLERVRRELQKALQDYLRKTDLR